MVRRAHRGAGGGRRARRRAPGGRARLARRPRRSSRSATRSSGSRRSPSPSSPRRRSARPTSRCCSSAWRWSSPSVAAVAGLLSRHRPRPGRRRGRRARCARARSPWSSRRRSPRSTCSPRSRRWPPASGCSGGCTRWRSGDRRRTGRRQRPGGAAVAALRAARLVGGGRGGVARAPGGRPAPGRGLGDSRRCGDRPARRAQLADRAPPIPAGRGLPRARHPDVPHRRTRTSTGSTSRCGSPAQAAADWSLRVHGMVDRELTLSFADLLARPLVERTITLTCVSNPVGGDLISTANFIGVELRDMLLEAGVRPGRRPAVQPPASTAGPPAPRSTCVLEPDRGRAARDRHERRAAAARARLPGADGGARPLRVRLGHQVDHRPGADHVRRQRRPTGCERGWAQRAPIKTQSRIDRPARLRLGAGRPGDRRRDRLGAAHRHRPGRGAGGRRAVAATAELSTEVNRGHLADVARRLRRWRRAATPCRPGPPTAPASTQTEARADPIPDGATGWPAVIFTVALTRGVYRRWLDDRRARIAGRRDANRDPNVEPVRRDRRTLGCEVRTDRTVLRRNTRAKDPATGHHRRDGGPDRGARRLWRRRGSTAAPAGARPPRLAAPPAVAPPPAAASDGVTTNADVFGPACGQLPQGDAPGSLNDMGPQPVASAATHQPAADHAGHRGRQGSRPGRHAEPAEGDHRLRAVQRGLRRGQDGGRATQAFNALLDDQTQLGGLLSYHVVPKRYDAAGLVDAGKTTELAGGDVTIGGTADAPTVTERQRHRGQRAVRQHPDHERHRVRDRQGADAGRLSRRTGYLHARGGPGLRGRPCGVHRLRRAGVPTRPPVRASATARREHRSGQDRNFVRAFTSDYRVPQSPSTPNPGVHPAPRYPAG